MLLLLCRATAEPFSCGAAERHMGNMLTPCGSRRAGPRRTTNGCRCCSCTVKDNSVSRYHILLAWNSISAWPCCRDANKDHNGARTCLSYRSSENSTWTSLL